MALAALLTTACNKDEVILDDRDHAPVITLDSESGVYTVKTDRELTIAPTVGARAVRVWYSAEASSYW